MGRPKKYLTEEERKAAKREKDKIRYEADKNKRKAWDKAKYERDREHILEQKSEYYHTENGRSKHLLGDYKKQDKKLGGETTITPEWIIENVFHKYCHYCGETDWKKLGCDRKDSSLPHTPENCVPCCAKCNSKKGKKPYDEYMRLIGKVG